MDKYWVHISKDHLSFSAGHFITFEGGQCERLHGHNYRVSAEVEGPLNDDFLVVDFSSLQQIVEESIKELDHRMLIPLLSSHVRVEHQEKSVALVYGDRKWEFPRSDCALLPLENTTSELIARWLSLRLRAALTDRARTPGRPGGTWTVRVEVEESPGQSASCEASG